MAIPTVTVMVMDTVMEPVILGETVLKVSDR